MRQQGGARLGFLEPEKPGTRLDDGNLGPNPGERLGELDANGPATQHHQPFRQLAGNGRLPVRPVLDLVQPFDLRYRGGAAVGDHHRLSRHELFTAHLDGAQVDQLPRTPEQLRPGRLQRRGRPRVVEVSRHPKHSLGHFRKVDVPLDTRGGQRARTPRFLESLSRAEKRLGWDAAPVRTLASHELTLDDCERYAAALKQVRQCFTRHAAAQTYDVKLLWHSARLLAHSQLAVTPAMTWR